MKFLDFFRRKPELPAIPTGEPLGREVDIVRRLLPRHEPAIRAINERMLRMYDAATTTNLNVDFPMSITSANAEILTSLMATRARARRLERDNPYFWAVMESMQKNVGGHDPFRLEMKVGKYNPDGEFIEERDTNREIEQAWEEAGMPENCTVRRDLSRLEMDLQAISAVVRDGGGIYRKWAAFPNNPFNFALQPLEIDRLDQNWQRPRQPNSNKIQFSIERDQWDAPIFYHLLTRHPGDTFAYSNETRYRERVPAEDIIAIFDLRSRIEQEVGMPRASSAIQRLHRIDQFDIAHVTAAIWTCCKPWFLIQKMPTALEYIPDAIKNAMNQMGSGDQSGTKVNVTQPGEGETLPFGVEPMLIDPKFPNEAASAFTKDNLRGVAAGTGTAYHMIANDLEGVNFSSGRLGENAFHDTCKILQKHFIISYRRPHFNAWLPYAIMSGQIKQPMTRLKELQRAAVFHGRRWPYINPLQDVQADILAKEAGFTSRSRIIADSDRGGDVEEVNSEQASDKASDDAHGLDFSNADPTKPDVQKGVPGETVPNAEAGGAKKPGGKQTIKKRKQFEKLEKTLRLLDETDPEFRKAQHLENFLTFKKMRNGHLTDAV